LELLGARTMGMRVTIKVPESKGVLAKLTQALAENGANIISLGTFFGDDLSNRTIAFKVQGIDEETMRGAVERVGAELVDLRVT